jgi:ATP-dependent Clp protease ATP-binding subunit ClpB
MGPDKFTTTFQSALQLAQSTANRRDHQFIEPVHLMAALLEQKGPGVGALLDKAGANLNLLRSKLGEALDRLPQVEGTAGDLQISADLGRLLNLTEKLAQKRGDQFISSELFVLAACDDKGTLGKVLKDAGVVKGALDKHRRSPRRGRAGPERRGHAPGA